MVKADAILLMIKGTKITHRYFSENEWMVIEDDLIILEDWVQCTPHDFWEYRQSESWDDGYSVYES